MQEKNYQGEISVTTEHIFPIIKRWLYSDKDIFLREIVSNASDAITKLSRLRSLGEAPEGAAGRIDVLLDEAAGTLTVRDNGIGMTSQEVDRYLNSIALSGALEFIEKYEGENAGGDGIIGHFGLGFYSAFMVATRVEVITKSYRDEPCVQWTCTDAGAFEMKEAQRSECGTDVILYLSEEEKDYLKREKCAAILEKYCSFLAYPVYLSLGTAPEGEATPLNETEPLWMKSASQITDEEYKAFYHKLFGYRSEPLFWVHINADYPLNFRGILYFPRLNHQFESMEGEVKLYYNRVFVADNISEVIPEYLLSLKGVLDCPELPLNVSRSFLQNSPYVTKLSAHIAKKVADKLSDLYRSDRAGFEGFAADLRPFLQYGAIKDAKFFSRIKDLVLFENTDGAFMSVSEYLAEAGEDKKVTYTTDKTRQAQYVKLWREQGRSVLCFESIMDTQYASFLEQEQEGVSFVRVDSDADVLTRQQEVSAEDEAAIRALFSSIVKEDAKLECVHLKDEATPALFATEENARRMEEMLRMYRAQGGEGASLPTGERLLVNLSCPACLRLKDAGEKAEILARQIYYTALISARALTAEELSDFLENNNRLLML